MHTVLDKLRQGHPLGSRMADRLAMLATPAPGDPEDDVPHPIAIAAFVEAVLALHPATDPELSVCPGGDLYALWNDTLAWRISSDGKIQGIVLPADVINLCKTPA